MFNESSCMRIHLKKMNTLLWFKHELCIYGVVEDGYKT